MEIVRLVNGKTALFGVIGDPIEHTKSPFIHNTLFKELGINAIYLPIHVSGDGLEKAVAGLKAQNFSGFNVTVPHKQDIIKYLDDVSKDALLMGAVNTVKNIGGRLKGYNTDATGFVRDFENGFNTTFNNKKVLLLGAGGTARALAVKLCMDGVRHLTIVNRTEQNARNIVELIRDYCDNISYILPDGKALGETLKEADIIINTTPVGMSTYGISTPFNYHYEFNKEQLVYDVVYSPRETPFLQRAKESGCLYKNGFGMLINQAISAFEIWTGRIVPQDISSELLKLIDNLEDL